MNARRTIAGLVLGILTLSVATTLALAETAQEAFDQGQALMAKGDYEAALPCFATAAKADATNQTYVKRYTVARRVVDYRAKMNNPQTDPKQWELIGRALRSFYIREDNLPEALTLTQQMHEKLNTAASAVMLAEVQLAMDKNEDGVKTLQAIEADKTTVASQALLALGLDQVGKKDEGKQVLAKLAIPDKTPPGGIYLAARAYGALGDAANAMATLTRLFESVPAPELDAMKASAKTMPEFAAFASTPEFEKVLQTQSKVTVSECTGGSDCSTCPLGAKCPSGAKAGGDAAKK